LFVSIILFCEVFCILRILYTVVSLTAPVLVELPLSQKTVVTSVVQGACQAVPIASALHQSSSVHQLTTVMGNAEPRFIKLGIKC